MADNVELNSGSGGEIVATDQIGTSSGPHYQIVKPAYGALGTATLVTSAAPLPVVSGSSGVIAVSSGTITLSSATSLSSGLVTLSSQHTVALSSVGFGPSYLGTVSTAGYAPVTSSFGLLSEVSSGSYLTRALSSGIVTLSSVPTVTATLGTNPWSSAPGFNIPIVSASSGFLQISGTPTVTATAGTNPWSSAPGFNVPVVSVSSGLVQTLSSGPVLLSSAGVSQLILPITSTAGYAPVTSSAGLVVNISSGTITLSSNPTVVATQGTNPWSSAPGFNVPIVSASSGLTQISGTVTVLSASSGLVQISGTPLVLSASSGLIQMLGNVTTSTPELAAGLQLVTMTTDGRVRVNTSAGGAGSTVVSLSSTPFINLVGTSSSLATVTSSGGLEVTIVSGAGAGSTQVHIVGAGNVISPVTSSFGLLTQVSSGSLIGLSSGTVTLSSVPTVTATAATNPWSSAPGFNVPIVSVSSGLVQISGTPTVTATAGTNPWSSAPSFNVPIVSVSSGAVRTIPLALHTTEALRSTWFQSTGGAASVSILTSATNLVGYSYFNSTATIRSIKIYAATSAPTVGTTTKVLLSLVAPGSTGGGGANVMLPLPGLYASGLGFTMTANVGATDTGAPGLNDLTLNLYFV